MMKTLVLKLPEGKPPFIGVLFDKEYEGAEFNCEIVEKYPHLKYKLDIEHTPHALNLRLICEERVYVYFYDHLAYNAHNLKSWLYLTRHCTRFNFGHVSEQFNKHQLILSKYDRKKFTFPLQGYTFKTAESPDEDLPYTTNYRKW